MFCVFTEALWQPARRTAANENRRPIFVFSTDLANSAADAVLKNRYDSIIQFHNAQPKCPGFLRLSKKDEPKSDMNNTVETSESENEETPEVRAPKRRSSRLSTSDDTPTTKKLRRGGQVRVLDDSKRTRFSRRLRKQQQASSSPPSSAGSEHSSSDDESHPSPPSSHRGRGSAGARSNRGGGRRGRGRGRGRGRRNSSPVVHSRRQSRIEETEEDRERDSDEEDEDKEVRQESDDGEMDTSKDTDKQETAEDDEEEEPFESRPDNSYDLGRTAANPPQTAVNLSQNTVSEHQEAVEDENNYTICHGTPRTKGNRAVDMSSPVALKPPSQPQMHKQISALGNPPAGTSANTLPSVSTHQHSTQHDIASLGLVDNRQKQMTANATGILASGGSANRDPMLGGAHTHPDLHKDAVGATASNNWAGSLGPQFPHVPSGYYSAGIHPMHYPPHAAQHVPSAANYSYGVYPWGAHAAVGREEHPYMTHESAHQHARSAAALAHAGHQSGGSHGSPLAYQHHPHTVRHARSSASSPGDQGKDVGTSGGVSQGGGHESSVSGSATMAQSHEKHPLAVASTQSHHPHQHAALRQLPGSAGTATAALSQMHHATAFPRPPQAGLTTEQFSAVHHPAAAFPYSFDPSNPAALSHMHHLWQQQHQIRAAGGVHPSHLPPHLQHPAAAGMWYAPHVQQLIQHGGALPEDLAKRRALATQQQATGSKHSTADALRMNTNRNNNITSATILQPAIQSLHGTLPHGLLTCGHLPEFGSQSVEWNRTIESDMQKSHMTDSFPR